MNGVTPPEIAFVGHSGSGKTTLIEALLPRLAAAGLRIGVVKHTHHLVDWDRPGKDSWRFRKAGASRVMLRTPELLMVQARQERPAAAGELLAGLDLVLHEGDRRSAIAKILVGETLDEARARATRGDVIAVVGAAPAPGLPWFDRNDIAGLGRLLIARSRPVENATFEVLLQRSVQAHEHLCPGQVLGVRMTIRGLRELGLSIPPPPKRLIAVVETDRCAADAVGSVSGCSLGKRTLKHYDFGKMAASFLDLATGNAVRVVALDESRARAALYAPGLDDVHGAQTAAYRLMRDEELLAVERITMELSEADLPGRPRGRVTCSACGESVSDGREVIVGGGPLCRSCAGGSYYVRSGAPWKAAASASAADGLGQPRT